LKTPNWQFKNLQTTDDYRQAAEIFARTFAIKNSYWNHFENIQHQLTANPTLNPKNVWFIEVEGVRIGATFIFHYPLQVANTCLQMAGIGGVCTEPQYRHRGYNKALLNYCLNYMYRMNVDISLLAGIPDYYDKFGYAAVMPTYQLKLNPLNAIRQPSTVTIRRFRSADQAALQLHYEQEFRQMNGIHLRSGDYWRWLLSNNPTIYVAEDKLGNLAAYVWLESDETVKIKEAAGRTPEAIASLVQRLGQLAQQRCQSEITGNLHPLQPFARWTLQHVNGQITSAFENNGGWMGRIIHLSSTLKKFENTFSQRLATSQLRPPMQTVLLKTDLGEAVLQITPEQVRIGETELPPQGPVVQLTQASLMQLLFGYLSVEELIDENKIELSASQLALFKCLFPTEPGFIAGPDNF
jgi:predicted acetyltransferase